MTKQALLGHVVKEVRILFPVAEAIVLWGGALRRAEIASYGDIDILIVLPTLTDFLSPSIISRLQQYKTIFASSAIDLDPFITNATQLTKSPLRFAGPDGEYFPHGLIHYQLKYDSSVVWGNQEIKTLIAPVRLEAALSDIVPKVLTHGVQKIRAEFRVSNDPLAYAAKNKNALLIIARTIYSLREGKLATKEEAISYLKRTYPSLTLFADLLLQLYLSHKTLPTYRPSTEEMEDFLNLAETLIKSFLATGRPAPDL